MVCSSVIGAWCYSSDDHHDVNITTQLGVHRAMGPSLGTICFASLILTLCQSLNLLLRFLRYITTLPMVPQIIHPINIPIAVLQNVTQSLSQYALVYAGLTGESFLSSARRSRAVTSVKRPGIVRKQYSLLSTLLTFTSLTLAVPTSLTAYLFTAHSLDRPHHAPIVAFLTGLLTCLTTWFSMGLVIDTADTLYICYCLDKGTSSSNAHSKEVAFAFEGRRDPVNTV